MVSSHIFSRVFLLLIKIYHLSRPCDEHGNYLQPDTPPPARTDANPDDWTPFGSHVEFETAEFLYKKVQMSAGDINFLFELWTAYNFQRGGSAPFNNAGDMYRHIDNATLGEVPWQSFTLKYQGAFDPEQSPSWKGAEHVVWFMDPHEVVKKLLANPDFTDGIDFTPH